MGIGIADPFFDEFRAIFLDLENCMKAFLKEKIFFLKSFLKIESCVAVINTKKLKLFAGCVEMTNSGENFVKEVKEELIYFPHKIRKEKQII